MADFVGDTSQIQKIGDENDDNRVSKLKQKIQSLCEELETCGEQSIILTANPELQSHGHMGSQAGLQYIQTCRNIEEGFAHFCEAQHQQNLLKNTAQNQQLAPAEDHSSLTDLHLPLPLSSDLHTFDPQNSDLDPGAGTTSVTSLELSHNTTHTYIFVQTGEDSSASPLNLPSNAPQVPYSNLLKFEFNKSDKTLTELGTVSSSIEQVSELNSFPGDNEQAVSDDTVLTSQTLDGCTASQKCHFEHGVRSEGQKVSKGPGHSETLQQIEPTGVTEGTSLMEHVSVIDSHKVEKQQSLQVSQQNVNHAGSNNDLEVASDRLSYIPKSITASGTTNIFGHLNVSIPESPLRNRNKEHGEKTCKVFSVGQVAGETVLRKPRMCSLLQDIDKQRTTDPKASEVAKAEVETHHFVQKKMKLKTPRSDSRESGKKIEVNEGSEGRSIKTNIKKNAQKLRDDIPQLQCDNCNVSFANETDMIEHGLQHESRSQKIGQQADLGERAQFNVKNVRGKSSGVKEEISVCSGKLTRKGCFVSRVDSIKKSSNAMKGFKKDIKIDSISERMCGSRNCKACGKSFKSERQLARHIKSHAAENPFMCVVCGKVFTNKTSLNKHASLHTYPDCITCGEKVNSPTSQKCFRCSQKEITKRNQDSNQCQHCDKTFKWKSSLRLHQEIHFPRLKCDICNKKFESGSELDSHVASEHPQPMKYECFECEINFNDNRSMQSHVRKFHRKLRVFDCKHCSYKSRTSDGLKQHCLFKHSDFKPYTCEQCGKGFKLRRMYLTHFRLHTGERPFKCSICERGYRTKESLKAHENTHTHSQVYVCDFCGKKFYARGHLYRHRVAHLGEKRVPCTFCGEKFSNPSTMRTHVHRQHKEAALASGSNLIEICHICGKTFAHKKNLASHLNQHTGARPFHCSVCKKSFADYSNLRQHRMIHTGEKNYGCPICFKLFLHNRSVRIHLKSHGEEGKRVLNSREINSFAADRLKDIATSLNLQVISSAEKGEVKNVTDRNNYDNHSHDFPDTVTADENMFTDILGRVALTNILTIPVQDSTNTVTMIPQGAGLAMQSDENEKLLTIVQP